MSEKKASLPEDYTVPDIWEVPPPPPGMPFNDLNRPTAGARFEKELPKGKHPIQLYSLATPNGQKVTIMLEELVDELGIDYDAWIINILDQDQFGSDFTKINPNSKIPAMVDYSVQGQGQGQGQTDPIYIFESGSILLYLAEKYQKFIPTDIAKRTECINWLMWHMGTAPFLGGGFGHFYKYAPIKIEYAINRYTMEVKRIVDVLDKHLGGADGNNKTFICGDQYTIADMAIYPWMRALSFAYSADTFLQMESYTNVRRWMDTIQERDAVKRGLLVNSSSEGGVPNRHSPEDFQNEEEECE